MSQRLIKPGLAGVIDPRTGQPIVPIGYIKGRPVWPVMGGAPDDSDNDDPNDPKFQDGGGAEDDEDDDDDDEDEDKSTEDDDDDDEDKKPSKSKKKSKDDDDDEDDESPRARASRQAAKYRVERNQARKDNEELRRRLQALEDKGKKPEEIRDREFNEAKSTADKLTTENSQLRRTVAFLRSNAVDWIDPDDALTVAEREGLLDDVMDDDGTVDRKALRAALRDLAKRKPHLVRKAASSGANGGGDKREESSGASMNGRRKGQGPKTDRAALAKRFSALNRV